MVETPRAALAPATSRASSAFLSFGTNDLTQMTYGLSRDDAGRFMRDYVNRGVFHEDPFHSLDLEGVGELMLIAAKRGPRAQPRAWCSGLCGEHGGDPPRCASASSRASTTSPARRSACRSRGWRRRRRRSSPAAPRSDGRRMKPLPGDLPALAAGGKAALARCLSALESAPDDPALVALLEAAWASAAGRRRRPDRPPGVGKSTLASALIARLRAAARRRR